MFWWTAQRVATARALCRGLLDGMNPERAHGIKNMPWLPLRAPCPLTSVQPTRLNRDGGRRLRNRSPAMRDRGSDYSRPHDCGVDQFSL